MNNNFNFEIKEKIVKQGGSEIFKNWHEVFGISEEDFIEGLRWLCDDSLDEKGRLTRELGVHIEKGLVKLKRFQEGTRFEQITVFREYDEETKMWRVWGGSGSRIEDTPLGRIPVPLGKISISARDRI